MAKRRSVMEHRFSNVPDVHIPRSSFNRSHGFKCTFNAGRLIPVLVDEVLPGDTFNVRMTGFARLATPLKPIMDNMVLDTHFFFVPYRQIWENFRKFMGEQENPNDSIDYTVPLRSPPGGGYQNEDLHDYFGCPTGNLTYQHSALPYRAYVHIYNEWFRDQNVGNSVAFSTDDGPDSGGLQFPVRRMKRHDYFTSALPWPQKGDPVRMPLGEDAPVFGIGINNTTDLTVGGYDLLESEPDFSTGASHHFQDTVGAQPVQYAAATGGDTTNLFADLRSATAATINQIREAFQVQKLLERDARGGTRYSEIVRSHFGVQFLDVTYRPVYLGGGSTPINVSPIAQTSATDAGAETPQGNLAAMGTASIRNNGFTQSFTEHGLVIGLASVRADLTYQQGLERFWSRQTRYDFFWPALAHLGEQSILNIELFTQGNPEDADVFGYQERYAEYRYKPSRISGKFRSNDPQSLDYWHLSQDFADLPALDELFLSEIPPIERIIAVPDEPHFLLDCFFDMKCARPIPIYGVPGLIDHF